MTIKEIKDKYLIILKKIESDKLDFNDFDNLEDFFVDLFLKIKKRYDSFNYGFYKLNIYLDKYYGAIIEANKIRTDFTLIDQVDMTLNIIEDNFLYRVDNYNFDRVNFDYYLYKGNIYAKIKNEISNILMYKLFENSKIIFNTEKLITSSKKI